MADRTDFVMERRGKLAELDRSFDIEYWQRLGSEAIFEEAWRMVEEAHRLQGRDPRELELQRSVEAFGRIRG
ncbi:MAG: hypothetical protein R2729_29195 [Bryobacteraceae bacterium]